MKNILNEFEKFCINPKIDSGKSNSYKKSILYLSEFFETKPDNKDFIIRLTEIQKSINDNKSTLYNKLLVFLSNRHQKSYLESGFIHAAITKYINFYRINLNTTPMTKVDAIKRVMQDNEGTADWQTIYNNIEKYYPNIKKSFEWQAGLRGVLYREIKNNNSFKKISEGNFSLINYDTTAIIKGTPIFFANITWMKHYDGLEGHFERAGASYVKIHNDAGEKNNFKLVDGKYYGFVQSNKNNAINIEKIASRYNCKIQTNNNDRYIDNALVVFFSTPAKGTAKIVGFYKNSKIFEKCKKNKNGDEYFFECDSDDGLLIPEKNRQFIIPKFEKQGEQKTYNYGQDQRWYANNDKFLPLINKVINYVDNYTEEDIETNDIKEETILSKLLKDSDIKIEFNKDSLTNSYMPICNSNEHKYIISRVNGTSKDSVRKIISGRKAEKYFIDYLIKSGFEENKDFIDVANNKNYGYDVQFADIGLEIKNIKSGSFYLSDNEIAYLESEKTYLVFIDIDNGIWLLKNNSNWLKAKINNIKNIREYSKINYPDIDLTDFKINITKDIEKDVINISCFDHNKIINIFLI